MKKRSKQILLGIVLIGLLSCSLDSNLKSARVIYGPEYATVIVPISCSSIEYDLLGVEKKKFTESRFLQKLERELEKLKVDSEDDLSTKTVDVRIKCFLDYKDKTDTLCLGEFSGVIFNGELMKDSQTLLELLKSNIYIKEK